MYKRQVHHRDAVGDGQRLLLVVGDVDEMCIRDRATLTAAATNATVCQWYVNRNDGADEVDMVINIGALKSGDPVSYTHLDVYKRQYQDRLPERLSGGQQQRVALARAIVIHPQVPVSYTHLKATS